MAACGDPRRLSTKPARAHEICGAESAVIRSFDRCVTSSTDVLMFTPRVCARKAQRTELRQHIDRNFKIQCSLEHWLRGAEHVDQHRQVVHVERVSQSPLGPAATPDRRDHPDVV